MLYFFGVFSFIMIAVNCNEDVCEINACEALEQSKIDLQIFIDSLEDNNKNSFLLKLERRVRSLEQPVWQYSKDNLRWIECSNGPCKCDVKTKSVTCWQQDLPVLPIAQTLPRDVISMLVTFKNEMGWKIVANFSYIQIYNLATLITAFIDLGMNSLTTLHKNSLRMLSYLTELDLFDNDLDYLPEDIFNDLDSLQYLRLHKNKLEDLPRDLLRKLKNLQTLDLSNNQIHHVPPQFFENTRRLIVLHMSRNRIKILSEILFNNLQQLEDLDFSNNNIERLPKFLFNNLANLKRLQFAENKIDLLANGLFDSLHQLEYLNLRKNQIYSLSDQLFNSLGNLFTLQLTSNHIRQIKPKYFEKLVNLTELHLGQNLIEELPENCFVTNRNLDKLYLFSNNLEELKEKSFNGLNNLTTLLINNNILNRIHPNIFMYTPNLQKLHLDSNKLHFLPAKSLDHLRKLVSIKLTKNPWHCDCNILYLAVWIDDNESKVWDAQPTCRGPAELGGSLLKNMGFNDLCDGQWASMLHLSPRIPIKQPTMAPTIINNDNNTKEK